MHPASERQPGWGPGADRGSSGALLRLQEAVSAAADFYADVLWGRDSTGPTRRFLARRRLEEDVLRRFGVGYSPIGWTELIDHLRARGFTYAEIEAAGLATRSHRRDDRLYDLFRSRVMFPIVDPDDGMIGFAALATHPGPSWPRWLISPDTALFAGGSAVFGLDQAAAAIGRAGEAIVLRDCIEVLDRHQHGERGAVGVIRSRITPAHLAKLRRHGGSRVVRGGRTRRRARRG